MQSDPHLRTLYAETISDVLWGSLLSLALYLIFGKQSAVPLSAYLIVKLFRLKLKVVQDQYRPTDGQSQINEEMNRLKLAMSQQQQQHLATIRKMKLEQNQILLKHHELQHILQQQE